jgi:endonuclease/exonuclease/phosphatase family protein
VTERDPVAASNKAARLERRMAALALRPSLSPAGPAPDRLRVATWNLNSLRARLDGLDRFLPRVAPDILCLQEIKAAEVSDSTRPTNSSTFVRSTGIWSVV